jgi:hypothetical protein
MNYIAVANHMGNFHDKDKQLQSRPGKVITGRLRDKV